MKSLHINTRVYRWGLLITVLLAWWLRISFIETVPGGIQHDEVTETLHGYEVLAGDWKLYYYLEGFKGREPMMAYLQAIPLTVIGHNLWGMRFLSVACGILTVILTAAIGKQLYSRLVGLVAGISVAIAFWPLVMSSLALRAVLVPPLVTAAVYLFWRGLIANNRIWVAISAGIVTAASAYAYLAGWMMPLVCVIFWATLLILKPALTRQRGSLILAWLISTILALLPISIAIARQPESRERVEQLSPLLSQATAGHPGPLIQNLLSVLGSFSIRGDQFGLYNIPNQPLLPLGFAVFFYIGLGIAVWRWRTESYRFLLLWLVLGLLPAALAVGGPNYLRSVVSLPPTYLLIGVGVSGSVISLQRVPTRSLLLTLVAGLFTWGGLTQVMDFTLHWPNNSDTRYFFRSSLSQVARDLPINRRSCISTPYAHDLSQWVVEYIQNTKAPEVCWFYGKHSLPVPIGNASLSWYVPAAISPDSFLAAQEDARISSALLALLPDATKKTKANFPDGVPAYDIYTANSAEVSIHLQEAIPPLTYGRGADIQSLQWQTGPATFDGGLTLIGTQTIAQPDEHIYEVLLLWQIDRGRTSPEPLSIFLQLLTPSSEYVSGDDHLDYAVNSWRNGDKFIEYHRIQIPPDLPAGRYYLQTGIYNWQTSDRWRVKGNGNQLDNRIVLPPLDLP